MASLLCTWLPRRITSRWYGSFWRTAPVRVWPLRYCTYLCVCVISCVCAGPVSAPHTFTVCLHVIASVVLTTFISSTPLPPSSFYHPDPTRSTSPSVSLLSSFLSHIRPSSAPSHFSALLPPPAPSLHEGLGRASLIGSVWWRGQSDLEWVTDEVRSARCLSLHGCCLCYCPDLRYSACGTHTHTYLPVTTRRQTHQHVHVRRWIADWANGTPRRLYSQLVYIYGQDVHTHGIFWHVCTCAKKQILHSC